MKMTKRFIIEVTENNEGFWLAKCIVDGQSIYGDVEVDFKAAMGTVVQRIQEKMQNESQTCYTRGDSAVYRW